MTTTIETGDVVEGRVHAGLLRYSGGLPGPPVVGPDEETAFTFRAGHHRAGAAVLSRETDAPVVYREVGRARAPRACSPASSANGCRGRETCGSRSGC
jgi:hypothetical protein